MHEPWIIDNTHILLRLVLSVVLGGLIGYERERNNHAAGLRTHILVCLGSSLVMMLSMYGFAAFANEPNVRLDPARLAAQVITGIGFLGAGTIVMTGKGVSGLTTAASVWVVMAIGLSVGAGFYFPAGIAALFVFLVLWGLNIVEKRYFSNRKEFVFSLVTEEHALSMEPFQRIIAAYGAKLVKVQFPEVLTEPGVNSAQKRILLSVVLPRRELLLRVTDEFQSVAGVRSVSAE